MYMKGNIWIGTYGDGVFLYDQLDNNFNYLLPFEWIDHRYQSNSVLSILESEGMVWVGTDGGGLFSYDRKTDNKKHFKYGHISELAGNTILSLHRANDKLYIGTFGEGLITLDQKTETFTTYRHQSEDAFSLSENTVWDILEDEGGMIWLGTNTGGLNLFNPETGKFKHFTYKAGEHNCLSSNSIRSIYRDSRNSLWIGTITGLNLFNPRDSTFTRYWHQPGNQNSLSNNTILSIHEDFNANLWLGTHGGGLNKFNVRENTFKHYKEEDGLPGNVVFGIQEDEQRNLWISTDKGLSRFNPGTEEFKNFDKSSGLFNAQFDIGASYKSRDGEMFFGSANGLCHFYPSHIKQNHYIPPVVLTDFQIFNKQVDIGASSPLRQSISEADTIFLDHTQSVLNFGFSALNFTHPRVPARIQICVGSVLPMGYFIPISFKGLEFICISVFSEMVKHRGLLKFREQNMTLLSRFIRVKKLLDWTYDGNSSDLKNFHNKITILLTKLDPK